MNEMSQPPYRRTIFVCVNGRSPGQDACANRGSEKLREALKEHVKRSGLEARVRVSRAMCLGLCSVGPNVCVFPENVWYDGVTEGDLAEIIRRHVSPERTDLEDASSKD